MIKDVAEKVASLGYASMTGFGYFREGNPKEFHSLSTIFPDPIPKLIKIIPSYTYLHELPRLGAMAVFYENQQRSQVHELLGCHEYGIPAFGFIIHHEIRRGSNSAYLADNGDWVECSAYDKSLCAHQIYPERFCPFYDSTHIPWATLELFLAKQNRLVAAKKLDHISVPLDNFLRMGSQLGNVKKEDS